MKLITTKLLAIMAEMGTINKDGYNDHNKYTYIKESTIAKKIQPLLVKHRVFIVPNMISSVTRQITTSQGKSQNFTTVEVDYMIICADSGETVTSKAFGEGMDTGDKALYKASTGAHKYFLIRTFNLGSDEDAEDDSPDINTDPQAPKPVGVAKPTGQGKFPTAKGGFF